MIKAVKFLLFLIVFSSCSADKNFGPLAYSRYMEDEQNEFKKSVIAGSVTYTVQLAPPEYMVSKEFLGHGRTIDTVAFRQRLNELNGYVFFLVRIQKKNDSKPTPAINSDPASKASYYQFEAPKDLSVVSNNLPLAPATYFFEDNYSLSPYNTIVAGFKCDLASDLQLTFNDRFEQNPLIKVTFSKYEISQLPHLEML